MTTFNNNLQAVKDGIEKEDLKADLKKLGTHMSEDVHDLKHDLSDYASSKAGDTIEELRTKMRELKSQGKNELTHLERKVMERPLRSVAIAAGIGAIASMIFGGRR